MLDPDSQGYADRYYHGRKTSTVIGHGAEKVAVTHCVFAGTHEALLPRLRSAHAARHYALTFANENLLRKLGSDDSAQDALDQFVAARIPEDERYW